MRTVGSYEAKTHLPKLLEQAAKGERIIITKHGVPVAEIVPARTGTKGDVRSTIEKLRELRKGLTLKGLTVREMIEEGRRF